MRRREAAIALALLASSLFVGCGGRHTFLEDVRGQWTSGRYEKAESRLEELEREHPFDRHVYAINRSGVELALGEVAPALDALRVGRDRLDELSHADYRAWFGATLESDERLPYAGEDYEKVLVRAMLAVTDLMQGGEDADAFALQVLEKQLEIIDTFREDDGDYPKKAYRVVGFGSYLRAILSEDSPLSLDLAEREYRRLKQLEPGYPYADEDIERVANGRFAAPGNGVVHVIALVGTGPYKIEVDEPVSTEAIAIAQVMLAVFRNTLVIPNLQSVKIPALAYHDANPTEVVVGVDGEVLGTTVTVTDVEAMATQQFAVLQEWVVARAVLRRVLKVGLTEGAKAAVGHGSAEQELAGLGLDIAGNIWTSRERADLRSWCLLPASFQAARIELPAGEHRLTLRAGVGGRAVGRDQSVDVRVRPGYSTFVVVQVPTVEGGPPPLTSDRAEDARTDPST
jgi:tetratricopeptide (TPR) repeat protein